MTAPSTLVTQTQPESPNKERVEAHLRALQDSNRLAMHVWEIMDRTQPSQYLRGEQVFDKPISPEDIPGQLRSNTMPLLPMSLIAPSQSTYPVRSYCFDKDTFSLPMFLFDLSQSQAHPARVLRAYPFPIASGSSAYDRKLRLKQKSGLEELDRLYADKNNMAIYRLAASEEGGNFTEEQLDTLAAAYLAGRVEVQGEHGSNPMHSANELIVAATKEHVAAFAMSYFEDEHSPAGYRPLMKLLAAGYGIQLHKSGIDVPVVFYDVSPGKKGTCTYIGQSAKELFDVALSALEEFQAIKDILTQNIAPNELEAQKATLELVKNVIRTTLGIDPSLPPEHQKSTIARLHREIERNFQSWQL